MKQYASTGRRKTSVAQVRMLPGSGKFTVNNKPIMDFFLVDSLVMKAHKPLKVTNNENMFDIIVKVSGGGVNGQADAVQLGIARALVKFNEELKPQLREAELLTRDPRMVERKKYGFKKARKSFQFSKR